MPEACVICAKHRGAGPLVSPVVWAGDLVVVTHRPGDFPGYLFVETRRHVANIDGLTEAEAMAVARAAWAGARALRAELDPESVHAAIAGRGLAGAHFHQHVFVRHRGTPAEFGWMDVDWPGAPREDVDLLCGRLSPYFGR
ncbi:MULTISPECIES: histidine triad (HIT) protein [Amycolatopsis]|uniref:Histidine triad (HIT) protein n=1 Tax=Amycolatopsis bullii TaxID=941987 RepID=A0ABQ3K283_9PSEU|nr:histidine triad (HIT) protein [Amycolatopsis bullii]GHG00753.1 histidine triad (HIT) protein [Amycolatopsis bullii]